MPRRPSNGNVGDGFGWRWHPIAHEWRHHDGEDIGWLAGTTLVAPINAQLITYANTGGWGRLATLRVANTTIRLAHTEKLWPGVALGAWLAEGAPVAVMGATGLAAGVHVHWEVLVNGKLVDPAGWLASFAAGSSQPFPIPEPKQEDDMPVIYWNPKGSSTVYAIDTTTGAKRTLGATEWRNVRAAYAAADRKVPLSNEPA